MKNLSKYKLIEISSINEINNDEEIIVYDLSVTNDASYTANNNIVHNCSTTVHTGVGYPMGSLVSECYSESCKLDNPAKIVADGGMQNYSDIIKALALGADYVMVGSLFNKAIESCGDNYLFKHIKVSQSIAEFAYKYKIPVYKKFRGMSTKEVQKKWGKEVLTTSEGVVRVRKVEYTLEQWVSNFEDYLRSAMSYTNSKTLSEFIGIVDTIKISDNSYNRFKK
jgi:glutamate synthase domain-containing protein 2